MKVTEFTSFEAFDETNTAGEYEHITVIRENGWVKSDLLTECKTYKTALKRFFKALDYDTDIKEWYASLLESCENNYFEGNDFMMADGTRNQFPMWAYGVEECNEGVWYIFLNIRTEDYTEE